MSFCIDAPAAKQVIGASLQDRHHIIHRPGVELYCPLQSPVEYEVIDGRRTLPLNFRIIARRLSSFSRRRPQGEGRFIAGIRATLEYLRDLRCGFD